MIDKIDIRLLKICKGMPGISLNLAIQEFLETVAEGPLELSPHALRTRLNVLEKVRLSPISNEGLVMLDRISVKRRVFCYITDAGEKYLAERVEKPSSEKEGSR